jgi:hypothetical protein
MSTHAAVMPDVPALWRSTSNRLLNNVLDSASRLIPYPLCLLMPLNASVCIRLVFSHEQVEPPENLVVPLQTGGGGEKCHLYGLQDKRKGKPIPVVQNPVVFVGKDDQSSWYSLPTIVLVIRSNGVKG